MNNLISTEDYAKLCGITAAQVRNRFYDGKIGGTYIKGVLFIDKIQFPPTKKLKGGRPSAKQILSKI